MIMDTPTLISTPAPKVREGVWLWMFKIFAGLMIVILLGIHFVINHLVAETGLLSYADVIRYYQNPIIPVMEIIFLVFVVSHALVGLRSILLDLNPSDRILRLVDFGLFAVGTVSIVYGVWLVFAIVAKG
jgi:succinate dehydrogenase hydrophobic anchor subunit